ncbi:MAG: hypothetical protein AAF804_15490, partial [Bacteroidota bacterium]
SIVEMVEAKSCAEVLESRPSELLVVKAWDATLTYHFNEGWLYQIDMVREFDKRKVGHKVFEESQAYFQAIRAEVLSLDLDDKFHQAALYTQPGRLFELEYKVLADQRTVVKLSSTSTVNKPLHHHDRKDALDWLQKQEQMTALR